MPRHEPRKPLTEEQKARAGDPENLKYAMKVAVVLARNWPGMGMEFRSAAQWALVKAAQCFDPARGEWFPYLGASVAMECRATLRSMSPKGFRLGNKRPQFSPVDDIPEYLQPVEDRGDLGWEVDYEDEILGLSESLTDRQKQAFRERFLNAGQTVTNSPDRSTLEYYHFQQACQRIREKLKRSAK
jgi:hypothetical protein